MRVRDYSRDGVLRSLESSLERLGLDRVDIVFVHDPDDHYREALDGAFPALEELRSQGVISVLRRRHEPGRDAAPDFVRETDLDVVMLAGRYTLLEQGALDDLLPACERRGVSVVAAGVFNSGLLARERPREDATYNYEPAPPSCSRACTGSPTSSSATARACRSPPAQFALAHPAVATVCLGARSAAQVAAQRRAVRRAGPGRRLGELVTEGLLRADAAIRSGR